MSQTKINSFVKSFIAFVKGDDAEVLAQKVYRQAESALKTHIAVTEGDLISKEGVLESAKLDLESLRVNKGQLITDRDQFVQRLLTAHVVIKNAQDELDAYREKLSVLKDELANLTA